MPTIRHSAVLPIDLVATSRAKGRTTRTVTARTSPAPLPAAPPDASASASLRTSIDLLVAKVLDRHGRGRAGTVLDGLRWAIDEGAHVVTMAFGLDDEGWIDERKLSGAAVDVAQLQADAVVRQQARLFERVSSDVACATAR